ncbi:cytochrome c oxidase subunit IV [Thiogranum longum]|uniref:Cytochrome c oxidase subunit IV n=2 Tax=Thiogranum longum TaxID=1537524 RepID=A0A4R1HAR9_9GAMM|nr:cytochrome c oxidase subunit IV [Thiogranum longum]
MDRIAYKGLQVWLILVALTLVTYAAGRAGLGGRLVITGLLLSVVVKGQLIADHFMGLRDVRNPWRWIVTGWLLVVVTLIGVAFTLGES